MKTLLLLLALAQAALAAPYRNARLHFAADFPGKVQTLAASGSSPSVFMVIQNPGPRAVVCAVSVRKTDRPLTARQALADLQEEDLPEGDTAVTVGGRPGLERVRVHRADGIPTIKRVVTRGRLVYLVSFSGFDAALGRKFLDSFRLLP